MGQGELSGVIRRVVAGRLECKRAMAGIGWAASCPNCMDRLRKYIVLLSTCRGLVSGKEGWLGSERVYDNR